MVLPAHKVRTSINTLPFPALKSSCLLKLGTVNLNYMKPVGFWAVQFMNSEFTQSDLVVIPLHQKPFKHSTSDHSSGQIAEQPPHWSGKPHVLSALHSFRTFPKLLLLIWHGKRSKFDCRSDKVGMTRTRFVVHLQMQPEAVVSDWEPFCVLFLKKCRCLCNPVIMPCLALCMCNPDSSIHSDEEEAL